MIPDGVARDAVLNNAAMRLEVSPQDLRVLIKRVQATPRTDGDESQQTGRAEPIVLDPTKEWLAVLALRDPAARAWLQAQAWDRVLDDGRPDSALLAKILDAEFRADDAASINSWLATLDAAEEAALSGILERNAPADGKVLAEHYWRGLERTELIRKRQALEMRLRAAGLSIEETVRINGDVMELHRQIMALPPGGLLPTA